jgi:large subunit ribosomal protein L21
MAEKSLKKAVIATGGKQYFVYEGEELDVELLNLVNAKSTTFEPLIVIDGEKATVGTPLVEGSTVTADIVNQLVKADKVVAIRYKPKKRVHKTKGHRQKLTRIKITKIA